LSFLDKTRRLLWGLAPTPPSKTEYYHVACPAGHRLRGERTEGYQALRCPTCGEGIFILPRSPLPDPLPPGGQRAPRPDPSEHSTDEMDEGPVQLSTPILAATPTRADELELDEADGDLEWLDPEPEAAPPAQPEAPFPPSPKAEQGDFFESLAVEETETASPPARTREPKKPPKTAERPTRPRKKGREEESGLVATGPLEQTRGQFRLSLRDWAIRHRHPLTFLGVILIVVATVGYRAWRSRLQELPLIVEQGREEGLAALDRGEFDTAHQLLSKARRAVDSLGGAVEGAAEIRQGAAEAELYTTLEPELLERILVEASADEETWKSRFDTFYKGRSLFFDCSIRSTPGSGDGPGYDLDYRILPNGEGAHANLRVGRIDLSGFKLIEHAKPKVGDQLQFGARLQSFSYDLDQQEWLARLEPDSGIFLTHIGALEALGKPAANDTVAEELP